VDAFQNLCNVLHKKTFLPKVGKGGEELSEAGKPPYGQTGIAGETVTAECV